MNPKRRHQLTTLLDGLVELPRPCIVSGLCLDSRQLQPGDLFIAVAGHDQHGLAYLDAAIEAGAIAVLWEKNSDSDARYGEQLSSCGIIQMGLSDLGAHLGLIADRFYGFPAEHIKIIAVTGTNGKTSICHFIAQALNRQGTPCAMMGTLGQGLPNALSPSINTTADAISIRRCLSQWLQQGIAYVAMEVSSHALVQGRISGLNIWAAIFTNLSRDHLDYHLDMEQYAAAKAMLLEQPGLELVVRNMDDAWSRSLTVPAAASAVDFTIASELAYVRASDIRALPGGIGFKFELGDGHAPVEAPLIGRFNVQNLLAAAAVICSMGWSASEIAAAFSELVAAPGRMNRLPFAADKPGVVIDYAHTPDALAQALDALRKHTEGQLWCVFGCGGDRDRGKRPLMARSAEQLADRVLITTDNPRTEVAEEIIEDILAGFERPQAVLIEIDRARAIARAIAKSKPGDQVLIAGKGHEPYQEINGVRHAYNDWACAAQALEIAA